MAIDKRELIAAIRAMVDRIKLRDIINAARQRDAHLASIEHKHRRRIRFQKWLYLKPGDYLYLHAKDAIQTTASGKWAHLWGEHLEVVQVHPVSLAVELRRPGRARIRMSWNYLDKFKASAEPCPQALADIIGATHE